MFCGNCGTQNPEGTAFCAGCGTKLNAAPAPAAPAPEAPVNQPNPGFTPNPGFAPAPAPQKSKKGLIIGLAVAAVAILAVVLILVLGGNKDGNSSKGGYTDPEELAEALAEAFDDYDIEKMIEMVHPSIVEENIGDEDDIEEYIEDWEDEYLDYFEEYNVSFDFDDVDHLSKSELRDVQDEFDDEYDLEVTDAYYVIIEMTIDYYGSEYTDYEEMLIVEIDGRWYWGGGDF